MVCHRSCYSRILLFGILYVAVSYNLPAQTTPTRSKEKKKQEVKSPKLLSKHDSLSIESKKLRISPILRKDSSLKVESTSDDIHFKRIPESLEKNFSPLLSDSLIPFQVKPSSIIDKKDQVLKEYRRDMDKKLKLGEKTYNINPNAFKPTPGNLKVEGAPQDFETIYDGGHFKQAPRAGGGATAPMPAFIVGGKKEVSKKDKRILKDVYDIEVK